MAADEQNPVVSSVDSDFVTFGAVHLDVTDRDAALTFWRDLIGLRELSSGSDGETMLGVTGRPLVVLHPGATAPLPRDFSGLYHLAILYPTRAKLADALRRVTEAGIQLDGAADHGVSEALYLRDPDNNGVELYWDKPKEQWPYAADGQLAMVNARLDLQNLLGELRPV